MRVEAGREVKDQGKSVSDGLTPWRKGVRENVADAVDGLLRATQDLPADRWPVELQPVVDAINTLAGAYLLGAGG